MVYPGTEQLFGLFVFNLNLNAFTLNAHFARPQGPYSAILLSNTWKKKTSLTESPPDTRLCVYTDLLNPFSNPHGQCYYLCLLVGIQKLVEAGQLAQIKQLQPASHESRFKPRPARF